MPSSLEAIFFDVDGVLIDSLPQHLQICRDKANEFGLNLNIPDVDTFRCAVSNGAKISPMKEFFLWVGFPLGNAEHAVADYDRDFMAKYGPAPFYGVDCMLQMLHDAGLKLGLVTSNTRQNVVPALGALMKYFDESNLFFFDKNSSRTKSDYLKQASRLIGAHPSSCIYIGDQPADALAAREAGFTFLGVTYGWGITKDESGFMTVDTVSQIACKILNLKAQLASDDLVKMQFDYAWKWFSFHADQRTKMFNFMWIVFGIIAAGVGGALDKERILAAIGLCTAGGLAAISFLKLDRRNRDLVRFSEDILTELEDKSIFPDHRCIENRRNEYVSYTILLRERSSCSKVKQAWRNFWWGTHRFWVPTIGWLTLILFILSALAIWRSQDQDHRNTSIKTLRTVLWK